MYLNLLTKQEKELFLQASLHLSNADGIFSEEEKAVITQLCREMDMPVNFQQSESLDKVLENFKTSNRLNRKIVVFELAGVIMADDVYDESEKLLMEKIAHHLDIEAEFIDQAIQKIISLMKLYKEIGSLIEE